MSNEAATVACQTFVVGAGLLVKGIMDQLGVVSAIDQELKYQPEIATTYGQLAQAIIVNRMTFDPQPLYQLAEWTQQRGLDRLLNIEAAWLDDDRLGALLEGVADHQGVIWTTIVGRAVAKFKVALEWLHADTTSVYFEGAYAATPSQPHQEANGPLLVEGYNKDGQRQKVQFVLSLITHQRLPLWYRPWNGNQTDDGVYLADLRSLRQAGWLPANVVLIGDRKLCNHETMVGFCRLAQSFLAAHPWTDTARAVWQETYQRLASGELAWTPASYVARNEAAKPAEQRTQYRVCEVSQTLVDSEQGQSYPVRWVFSWSSRKAELDARQREKALTGGAQALQRIAKLLGKYDYTTRQVIERRLTKALAQSGAQRYFSYTLHGSDEDQAWRLDWQRQDEVIQEATQFDGIALLCTNVPAARLTSAEVMAKYKEQVYVEQTIDFIKSPVQIRPMWLHSPKRLAGLTLLIMIAVLVAGLLEYQVRRYIAETGQLVRGLMPERRDNPYPTAEKLLKAFQDYTLVLVRHPDGREELHYPKLRPVQQQIWNIIGLPPVPT